MLRKLFVDKLVTCTKVDWRIYRDRRSWSMSRLTISRCVTVATAPPGTRDFDARTTSTTARTTSARITQPASTSYRPTDATAPQDSWASIARRRYPFAQKGTTPARTGVAASTTGPTIAANAQSGSPASIVPPTWMTALIICARYLFSILFFLLIRFLHHFPPIRDFFYDSFLFRNTSS